MNEPTELEVRRFLAMNVMQKQKLREKDPTSYKNLFDAANKMFPAEDNSQASGQVEGK